MDWKEWLTQGASFGLEQSENVPLLLLAALSGSLVSSLLVSFLYVRFYGGQATGSQVHRSFLLIGPSITAIFIAVQFSLPLSLGLLGALSIVRFRTPIKEAEEIGFILLVVATSLCWATLNVQLLGILLAVAVAGLALAAAWTWQRGGAHGGMLVISLPSADYADKSQDLLGLLRRTLRRGRLDSISESDGRSVISYRFARLDESRMAELRRDVVEVAEDASINLFFHHPGNV